MEYRKLRNLEVSAIGYGCMGLSHGYGNTPEHGEAIRLIREAYNQGCTFFDTAEGYGLGGNEELLGEAVSTFRDKVVIATKFGGPMIDGDKLVPREYTPAEIKRHCEASLKRLRTDHIDLYYQHRVSRKITPEEVADCMGQLIKEGKVGTKELDDKVRRILRLAFRTTMNRNKPFGSFCSEEHYEAARRIGEEGIVLLQNNGNLLPLDLNKMKRIAVIGENAVKMMTVGGGSSSLKVQHEISPLEGIRQRVGDKAEVVYARGYVGDPSGEYNGVKSGQDLTDNRTPEELIVEAVKVAKEANCVIFIGGLNKSAGQDCEDADRKSLNLSYGQDKVIAALAEANKNLVVVNISGNAIAMPWVKEVPAIVQAWFLGSEAGNSIASVLMGDVNPSGKLPFTFPVSLEDVGAHKLGEYPGVMRTDGSKIWDVKYNESIFVGYRWADKEKATPLFPFGHGLSYTTFAYGKAVVDKTTFKSDETLTVTVPITNTGKREGAEVVQLYIRDVKSALPRPVKELKGFKKIRLMPGETCEVTFTIDKEALSYFDDTRHEWVAESGKFEAIIAASAVDVRSKVTFTLSDNH